MSRMTTRSTRLPAWLDSEIRRLAERHGEGPSEALRRIVTEWWVGWRFSRIEFRDGPRGRRAALRGGPEVWEIVSAARAYGSDRSGLYEHFGWVPAEAVDEALAYHEHFPAEIDRLVAENERFERFVSERLARGG